MFLYTNRVKGGRRERFCYWDSLQVLKVLYSDMHRLLFLYIQEGFSIMVVTVTECFVLISMNAYPSGPEPAIVLPTLTYLLCIHAMCGKVFC